MELPYIDLAIFGLDNRAGFKQQLSRKNDLIAQKKKKAP